METGYVHEIGRRGRDTDVSGLFTDDDAVAPVIGVVLLVAITVIPAAVVASFVLGLGNSATDQTEEVPSGDE